MRRTAMFGILGLLAVLAPAVPLQAQSAEMQEYVVLYRGDASAGRQAVRSAGGKIVKENMAIGMATVTSTRSDFLASVAGQPTLEGGGRNRPVGFAPPGLRPKREDAERLLEERREAAAAGRSSQPAPAPSPSEEPLGPLQWNMKMIRATPQGSYAVQPGDKRVLVGIIDTGVDGSHPDIAPNFDRALSRNFTVDVPLVDGPCELEPDRSCNDPADVDENGHGTHVAGIIGAPINGLGIAGVAPNVTLVNLRAGQDSGLFFLQSTVDALTFAGDNGIDVVNMSFYTDPWLYNCPNNPADSPIEQMEQRTVIAATQRALDYAHARGVTKVAALGNEHTDLGKPTVDTLSPDFPPGSARTRTVDNSCLDMPTEGRNVIGVSSIGPSTAKADYSNYGIEQADVSAPGGYFRDLFGTPQHRTPRPTQILSAYPRSLALEAGDIDENGLPTNDFVIRDCQAGVCAYYQYLQGTSMAAPHASGVAALIVSQFGFPDYRRNATGRTFPPGSTQQILQAMATDHACPEPRLVSYVPVGRPASWDALCEGGPSFNGFYGHGIVDALSAVTLRPRR